MTSSDDSFYISLNGVKIRIGPADENEWAYFESLVRTDYDRCHPGESFEDLKQRARFSKEDQGLLLQWMQVAEQRSAERRASVQRVAA